MDKKIEEILITLLIDTELFNSKGMRYRITQLKQKSIESISFISEPLKDLLWNNYIIAFYQFTEMTIPVAAKKLQITQKELEEYIEEIVSNIIKKIICEEEKNLKKEAIKKHIELIALIDLIKEKPNVINCLKDEIINLQETSETNTKSKVNNKTWIHSRLKLNNYEIYMLKEYLFNRETKNDPSRNNCLVHITIINLFKKIKLYLTKLKYKEILNQNYHKIEELNINERAIRNFKRTNLNYISDVIEYTKQELSVMSDIGIASIRSILKEMQERNIVFLDDPRLEEILREENAGIKKEKTK